MRKIKRSMLFQLYQQNSFDWKCQNKLQMSKGQFLQIFIDFCHRLQIKYLTEDMLGSFER